MSESYDSPQVKTMSWMNAQIIFVNIVVIIQKQMLRVTGSPPIKLFILKVKNNQDFYNSNFQLKNKYSWRKRYFFLVESLNFKLLDCFNIFNKLLIWEWTPKTCFRITMAPHESLKMYILWWQYIDFTEIFLTLDSPVYLADILHQVKRFEHKSCVFNDS